MSAADYQKIQLCFNRMWQMWKTLQDCALAPGCPSVRHHHWHLPTMPQGICCEYLTCRDVSYWLLGDFSRSCVCECACVSTFYMCLCYMCPHLCWWVCTCIVLFVQIHLFSVLCKPTAQHLPTLFPLDRRHWVENVKLQHQEGTALLRYLASYFCFLQHFPCPFSHSVCSRNIKHIFLSFPLALLLLLLSLLSTHQAATHTVATFVS